MFILIGAKMFDQETQITWEETASEINTMILLPCSFWATAGGYRLGKSKWKPEGTKSCSRIPYKSPSEGRDEEGDELRVD